MAKYLLLYGAGKMGATEAEQQALMAAWTAWFTQIGDALVDPGNPTTQNAKTIASNGTVSDITNGMIPGGYSIVKADSMDAAVAIAKGCPVLQGGSNLMVFETFDVM
ncbi:MAG: hypothetical protein WCF84_20490 [Anaerolineae bacterium]